MSEETTDKAAALFSALAKAQGEFKPIEKNREVEITMRSGGKFKFRYADLEEILSKTRPALSANGLALIQRMEPTESGSLIHCDLMHAAGGILSSSHLLPKYADDDIKGFGALITYHRRYLVTSMLGVAADDDLDEDGQGAGQQKQPKSTARPERKTQAPEQSPEQSPAETRVLTGEEIANIEALASEVGKPVADICKAYRVGSIHFIKRSSYASIVKRLEESRAG